MESAASSPPKSARPWRLRFSLRSTLLVMLLIGMVFLHAQRWKSLKIELGSDNLVKRLCFTPEGKSLHAVLWPDNNDWDECLKIIDPADGRVLPIPVSVLETERTLYSITSCNGYLAAVPHPYPGRTGVMALYDSDGRKMMTADIGPSSSRFRKQSRYLPALVLTPNARRLLIIENSGESTEYEVPSAKLIRAVHV